MLDIETAKYFYDSITVTISEKLPERERLLKYYKIYKEFLNTVLEYENRIFSSYFAKTVFIIDNFQVPEEITYYLKRFQIYARSSSQDKKYTVKNYHNRYAVISLVKIVNYFSQLEIPENLFNIISKYDLKKTSESETLGSLEKIKEIKCVLTKKDKFKKETILFCNTEELGLIKIQLNPPWVDFYNLVWENATIYFFELIQVANEESTYKTISTSLIVLEPDYLFDATELSGCFQNSGANPKLYFLQKFCNSQISESLIVGNMVNTCLDELILNPNIGFDELFDKMLKTKPLQIIALALRDKESVSRIKNKVKDNYEKLRDAIKNIKYEIVTVEPSFISPKYGLQGRLDLLLEYYEEPQKKDIIELKSGGYPKDNILVTTHDGKKISSKVWNNNLSQITCYNLMLDSTFKKRYGTSSILYSSTPKDPKRNAENIHQKKQEVLITRNNIVAIEHQLMEKNYSFLYDFNPDKFGEIPEYKKNDLKKFNNIYSNSDVLTREYFHAFLTFILREISSSKLGAGNSNKGFSALWLESIDEKEEDYSVLKNLHLNIDESDMDSMYLFLESREEELQLSAFRKGDMVILYPVSDEISNNVWNNQILKATIKEITENSIKLSLRNKLFDKRILRSDFQWVIEPDYIDSSNKKLFNSIYNFFSTDETKQKLILGLKEPEFFSNSKLNSDYLNENQTEIVKRALSANDYFLIQGPPGTGKTSFVLKSIVENLYFSTKENVLVMAYTNRAVDEICSALKSISDDFHFLRTGSKESSEHQDVLLSALSEQITTRDLFIKIRDCRIFVSTVSSVISNPEILELKKFDTAIIDEATQILEPQIIGIITDVKRFILIGDEKQLPAVVTQNPINLETDSETLNKIHLHNLSQSLFERLLLCCKSNNWHNAFGMLKHQARMHKKIQEFPNKFFYNYQLELFQHNKWQVSDDTIFKNFSSEKIFSALSKNRIVFIESIIEKGKKVNFNEAKIVVDLINKIKNIYGQQFNESTLGVISPFRAQCAEIYRKIDKDLRKMVMIDTVERFQGSERDIIIISFAVNNAYQLRNMQSPCEIDNLLIDRKLNVAMTRAKQYLILIGNSEILSQSKIHSTLIKFIRDKDSYVNLNDDL
jgi:DNA replication ATP-dependent helicase Dna2